MIKLSHLFQKIFYGHVHNYEVVSTVTQPKIRIIKDPTDGSNRYIKINKTSYLFKCSICGKYKTEEN